MFRANTSRKFIYRYWTIQQGLRYQVYLEIVLGDYLGGTSRAMATQSIDPKNARLIITSEGQIAVECDLMGAQEQATIFGPDGDMPPQSLSTMLDDLLEVILAAPDPSDAARLRSLAHDLKTSQAKLETALAKLEAI